MSKIRESTLQSLPDSFFPESWKDDAKMGNYFAEFRPYDLNPTNYNAKMRFWKDLICGYCLHKGSSEFSISELKRVFKRKNCSPYCLDKVLEEMAQTADVQEKVDFLEVPQASWSGWAMDLLVKKPIKWGMNKVRVRDSLTSYVSKDAVVAQAEGLLLLFERSCDVVMAKEMVLEKAEKSGLTIGGAELALHYLRTNQRFWVETTEEGRTLCKFAPQNAKVQPISSLERSIFSLEETEKSLEQVIDQLETQINDLNVLIKQCLKDGKKQNAKLQLKKRHVLEKNLEKKVNVLENVQTVLGKIHNTQKDHDVIAAYKMGTDALKNSLAGSGITLDSVDEIIEEMKEVIEVSDEIETTLSRPTVESNFDESDLEKELDELLADEQPPTGGSPEALSFDEEIQKRLTRLRIETHDLPSIPEHLVLESSQL